jgi:hypothetical protein
MRPSISSAFSPRPSPKDAVPYSSEAQCQDLERLRGIWEHIQARHDRNAIDAYLSDVYGLVAVWAAEGREVSKLAGLCACYDLRCLIGRGCSPPSSGAPATRARPTSEPGANATAYKPDSEPLERFIRRKGGINACAARFSRRLGRGARPWHAKE